MKANLVNDNVMRAIAALMNDEIREELNYKLAPCTNEEFLKAYVKREPSFEGVLKDEFSIEL